MSTHLIPASNDAEDSIRWQRLEVVLRLCRAYLREPEQVISDDGATVSLVFTPDLTVAQQATMRRIIRISGMMRITPAEWGAIEADIDGLQTYLGVATPTLVQTAAANKAIIRVLRAILRD